MKTPHGVEDENNFLGVSHGSMLSTALLASRSKGLKMMIPCDLRTLIKKSIVLNPSDSKWTQNCHLWSLNS